MARSATGEVVPPAGALEQVRQRLSKKYVTEGGGSQQAGAGEAESSEKFEADLSAAKLNRFRRSRRKKTCSKSGASRAAAQARWRPPMRVGYAEERREGQAYQRGTGAN